MNGNTLAMPVDTEATRTIVKAGIVTEKLVRTKTECNTHKVLVARIADDVILIIGVVS